MHYLSGFSCNQGSASVAKSILTRTPKSAKANFFPKPTKIRKGRSSIWPPALWAREVVSVTASSAKKSSQLRRGRASVGGRRYDFSLLFGALFV